MKIDNSLSAPADLSFSDVAKDVLVGFSATFLSVVTLGINTGINDKADRVIAIKKILPTVYLKLLHKINSAAKCEFSTVLETYYDWCPLASEWVDKVSTGELDTGVLTWCLARPLYCSAFKLSLNGSMVRSRLVYLASVITVIFARTIDFAVGLVLAIGVSSTRGVYPWLNGQAINHLNILDLIREVSLGIRGIVNPGQFL